MGRGLELCVSNWNEARYAAKPLFLHKIKWLSLPLLGSPKWNSPLAANLRHSRLSTGATMAGPVRLGFHVTDKPSMVVIYPMSVAKQMEFKDFSFVNAVD
jgi:hypothetical protein